jgi:3-dehydroquinate synthase
MANNIVLIGMPGTGKTSVGREIATLLGWNFVDTDAEVVGRSGRSIEMIFNESGETAFRRLESDVLKEASDKSDTVIAVGGGAVVDPGNKCLVLQSGFVVALNSRSDTIAHRLSGEVEVRPLLSGGDPLDLIEQLYLARRESYESAHWTVQTDCLDVMEVAREVIRAWDLLRHRNQGHQGDGDKVAAVVHSRNGASPIYVGSGILAGFGEQCQKAGLSSTAYLVSDRTVFSHYGRLVQRSLEEAGIPTHILTIPPGESSKTLETAGMVYGWLAGLRAERGHFVVALGGGVVGDLVGFVAATFNRGMPFVQVPTSLAAMVDASIGGKTAIDLTQGKNLVGAFNQPRFIYADPQTLVTLSARQRAAGWAEAIKHGLIMDEPLLEIFEKNQNEVQGLESPIATEVIRRSMAIKAEVVSKDERETLGVRTLLNYGHTVGHALETATGYDQLLHGEAVSIGMCAAAYIAQEVGLVGEEIVERQRSLLEAYSLPTRYQGVDVDQVRQAMAVDKKSVSGNIHWVLLEKVGSALVRSDVPDLAVDAALQKVT